MVNAILNIIPGEIELKNSDFYLQLGLADAITFGTDQDS